MKLTNTFFFVIKLAIIAIYLVIFAGSTVRTTGSGMGCPDWPKCFDQWVPPTSEDQLPENYRDIFLEKRIKKLERFTALLENLGMTEVAEQIRNDNSLLEEEPFVAHKTWIEYINRLLGFLAGNLLILAFILSFFLWKKDKLLVLLSFLALGFTSFQGWLGSVVVTTNLLPWMVTVHMSFALLVLAILIFTRVRKYKFRPRLNHKWKYLIGGSILVSLFQIYIGTQVRQEIDVVAKMAIERSDWIAQLSSIFEVHRTFAILVILINGVLAYLFIKERGLSKSIIVLLGIVLLEVLTGLILAFFDMPAFSQPLHLILATLLFGVQVFLFVFYRRVKTRI